MECLWIMGKYPFPAEAGTEAYSGGLVAALASAGAQVTVLCLSRPDDAALPETAQSLSANITWQIITEPRRSRAGSLLSPLPASAYAHATTGFRRALARALVSQRWDAVIIDHLQMGWALDAIRSIEQDRRPVLAYTSHNHEATVRQQGARHHFAGGRLRAMVLGLDGWKVRRLEHILLDGVDIVTSITEEDLASLSREAPAKRHVYLPPGYSGQRVVTRTLSEALPRRAVMVGSFGWRVKQENLRRFLAAADPLFAAAGAEIRVVGGVPPTLVAELTPQLQATTFAGVVPSLDGELAAARVGVISEQVGGGFKLKALDYVFHRVPVAMLAGTAAGLPLESGINCLAAADESQLAAVILAALDDIDQLNQLQDTAHAVCSTAFDWPDRGVSYLEALETSGAAADATVREPPPPSR